MEDAIILYSSLALLFLIFALKPSFTRRHKNLPPSPPSIPIIGHLHLIKQPMHRILYSFSQKYGPIISLRFGSRLVVVVSSHQAAEECFTKNDIVLANRPRFITSKHIGYNYTIMTQTSYGDHWRNLRRITAVEVLSSHRLNTFLPIRREEIKRLLKKLSAAVTTTGLRQEFSKVDMKTILSELTFNMMMRMVAGKRYCGDDVEDEEEARRVRKPLKEVACHRSLEPRM